MKGQNLGDEMTVTSILEPTDTGNIASPVYSSAYDMSKYPGQKFTLILRAAQSLTGAVAHGVTFSIEDTTDDPRETPETADWAAKDASTVGAVLPKVTAVGMQAVSFWPKEGVGEARPWIRVKALSDDNATLFSVSAVVVAQSAII